MIEQLIADANARGIRVSFYQYEGKAGWSAQAWPDELRGGGWSRNRGCGLGLSMTEALTAAIADLTAEAASLPTAEDLGL